MVGDVYFIQDGGSVRCGQGSRGLGDVCKGRSISTMRSVSYGAMVSLGTQMGLSVTHNIRGLNKVKKIAGNKTVIMSGSVACFTKPKWMPSLINI